MARNINAPYGVANARGFYLRMVKKLNIDSPELKAFEGERKFKRQRAKLKETAAKEAAEIQLEARKHTASILEKMIEIANGATNAVESAQIQAAHFVYDRAYGKAPQTNINANMNSNGKPSEITGSALAKRIEAALKRVEELTGGGVPPPVSKERPADVRERDTDPSSSTKH